MFDDKCIQTLIDKYFEKENIFSNHQIESYDDLIDNIIPQILSQSFPISMNYNNDKISNITIYIKKINIEDPYYTENNGCSKIMTPNIVRLRNPHYYQSY